VSKDNQDTEGEIINFVFSKLELTGKALDYLLDCLFDMMLKNAGCETWLTIIYEVLTHYCK